MPEGGGGFEYCVDVAPGKESAAGHAVPRDPEYGVGLAAANARHGAPGPFGR